VQGEGKGGRGHPHESPSRQRGPWVSDLGAGLPGAAWSTTAGISQSERVWIADDGPLWEHFDVG
jgi:hypothetical protein